MPRFYLDLEKHVVARRRGQTPRTPAVSVLFGLEEALKQMLSEGMQAIQQRHKMIATQVRNGILGLGLELFARDLEYASDTVTAVKIPDGIKAGDLLGILRNQHGVVLHICTKYFPTGSKLYME